MSGASTDTARLWAIIVAYGLEEEYERDWLGRIKSRRTKHYLRAEVTPELAQLLAGASARLGGAANNAKALLASAPDSLRRLLSSQETKDS